MQFPSILIVSKKNNLVKEVKKLLVAKDCDVVLVEKVGDLSRRFRDRNFDYIIYFDSFGGSFEEEFSIIKSLASYGNAKQLFVFPYTQSEKSFSENSLKIKDIR